jgi:hypothetical protein
MLPSVDATLGEMDGWWTGAESGGKLRGVVIKVVSKNEFKYYRYWNVMVIFFELPVNAIHSRNRNESSSSVFGP